VLLAPLAAGVLDRDAAHGLGGGEDVPPAVALPPPYPVDESEVRLVHQGGGPKHLAGPLSGQLMRGPPEDQADLDGCLNLVTNAVIAWNTVYMGR
jgi:hypothetical protein